MMRVTLAPLDRAQGETGREINSERPGLFDQVQHDARIAQPAFFKMNSAGDVAGKPEANAARLFGGLGGSGRR